MTTRPGRAQGCVRRHVSGCGSGRAEPPRTIREVVDRYLENDAGRSRKELEYFGHSNQSLEQAIERAARSAFDDGTIHPHQRRIGHRRCAAIALELRPHAKALQACRDFESLRRRVGTALESIFQDGWLTVYDIAQRIGHYLGVEPDLVYLHCGVRDGAKALIPNLRPSRKTLRMADLPPELRRLSPAQCEDLLCIYKGDLQRIGR